MEDLRLMTDRCGVRWGTHYCQYANDGHLVGVDCECHCGHTPYPTDNVDFRLLSDPSYGDTAQRNYEHAIRFGPA